MIELSLDANGIALRSVMQNDLEMIRTWRNDTAINQYMLTQDYISKEAQVAWFSKIKESNSQAYSVILYKDQPIGMASLRAFDGQALNRAKVVEPGLYISDERYRGTFLAFCPAIALIDYAYGCLGATLLVARVLSNNTPALRFNKMLGYSIVDVSELAGITATEKIKVMELTYADFQRESKKMRRFIRY